MILTNEFLNRYLTLPTRANYSSYGKLIYTWRLSRPLIHQFLSAGNGEIDFLWHSLIFNLFSKTVFVYSPENYTYCNHCIAWKFNHTDVMGRIYSAKVKHLSDEFCRVEPQDLYEAFYNYSSDKMNDYSNEFRELFLFFGNICCDLNYDDTMVRIIKNPNPFKEEFSDDDEHLSKKFLNSLLNR